MTLNKDYNHEKIEQKWVRKWQEEKTYKFDIKTGKEIYSVDTPPPTVSGRMHVGHASSYSQQDVAVRYKRMTGYETFYPFGTDDNGLPTEILVEKLNNVKQTEMTRAEFIDLCMKTIKEITPEFIQDWKNIGMSCDFNIFYSTIDEHCRKISQKSFIELYKKGRQYRMEAPTLWCTKCRTAIAQVLLEDKELISKFIDVKFELENGEKIVISTTRPELIPACVAIIINPNDKKNKKLIGKKARTPIFNQTVEIIGDDRVDPKKGSGIVMCCTFGDQTDIEWYKQYKLPLKIIITKDGTITGVKGYEGATIKDARKKMIQELEEKGLIEKEKEITHTVNVHERCGTEVEIIPSTQWFIKYLDMKEELLKAGREMNWHPKHMKVRYDNLVKGLKWDLCVSRQRFFGIPIPAWYCEKCGEVILPEEKDLPIDPLKDKPGKKCKCGSEKFKPDNDVLDTWATSALTPTIAVELIKDEKIKKKIFPMNLRPNAHDIITFWLFNTVVKSRLHYNKNPWKDIIISGFILDSHGKKMSKSKGNVVEPGDVIKKYGADALRYWATNTSLGEDIRYKEEALMNGKRLLTKIWNAARFIEQQKMGEEKEQNSFADEWIRNKLDTVVKKAGKYFDKYELSKAAKEIHVFFWQDFCDNYLEMIKYRIYGENKESKNGAIKTVRETFEKILKILAPITPFITEEIWREMYDDKSIHLQEWPETGRENKKIIEKGEMLKQVISAIRTYKNNNKMSMAAELEKITIYGDISGLEEDIKGTMRIKNLIIKQGKGENEINEKISYTI